MVAGAGGDRYDGGQVGESGAEVAFAGGGVQPEQHRPGPADRDEQLVVAGDLAGQDAELFGAGVVLKEERDLPADVGP